MSVLGTRRLVIRLPLAEGGWKDADSSLMQPPPDAVVPSAGASIKVRSTAGGFHFRRLAAVVETSDRVTLVLGEQVP